MPRGIRYDSARAAAHVALELFTGSPRASEGDMLDKLTEVILLAIGESERRRARRFSCLECFRTVHFRDDQEGRRVRCPYCNRKQPAPGRQGGN